MKPIFFTSVTHPLERWSRAFPELGLCSVLEELGDGDLVWLDCQECPCSVEVALASLRERGIRFVAMEPALIDDRGLWFLQMGASGYVHRYAFPDQLKDIALVVQSGGVWMGQELLQRALQASLTIAHEVSAVESRASAPAVNTSELTERELAVAEEVGKGASNREIAQTLGVSERTVKAHLSVVFEKMQVRDRVQLALLMNNVKI